MTDTIPTFSVTGDGNNRSTFLFPELLRPSRAVNSARQLQAAVRRQWNQGQWFQYGRGDLTATFDFLSSNRFSVLNAREADQYHVGRRVRAIGPSTGTITGSITAVDQSGGNTNVTVNWDSGGLSNENFIIEIGIISAVNSSLPRGGNFGQIFNGDNDFEGSLEVGQNVQVSGELSARNASFGSVNLENGPFDLISQQSRLSNSSPITVPTGTRIHVIELWSAGGGGSSSDDVLGADGEDAVLLSRPVGRRITVAGGIRGGAGGDGDQGQNQATSPGLSTAGEFLDVDGVPGIGGPGGPGGPGGVVGNPGGYAKAVVEATEIEVERWLLTGGDRGFGGGDDGGGGGRSGVIITFYG